MQFVDKIGVIPDDPFAKVKSLITDLVNRVQSEKWCHEVWCEC